MHNLNEVHLTANPDGTWYAAHRASGALVRCTAKDPPEQHPTHRVRSPDVAAVIGYLLAIAVMADLVANKGGGFKA